MSLYTLAEAAKMLRVHKRTMYFIIARAGLKKGPLGRWRFSEQQIMKMGMAR